MMSRRRFDLMSVVPWVVQEALHNAISTAGRGMSQWICTEGPPALAIVDNGQGLTRQGASMTPISMRNVSSNGGTFSIHSTPGTGTRLEVVVQPADCHPVA